MIYSNSSTTVPYVNDRSTPPSFFTRDKLIVLIILAVLILSLSILILLIILKYRRKKKKKIQRQKVIIKKTCELKTDIPDDRHTTLVKQNDDIDNLFLTDPFIARKMTVTSAYDTPRSSTLSTSSQHISNINGTNNNDDLSDFNLTNIPLRRLKLSNKDLTNPLLHQITNSSSNDSFENPYMAEYKRQEREKAKARQEYIDPQISPASKTSEESCL